MEALFIFFSITFICNYLFHAKSKQQVWLISILIPFICLVTIIFILTLYFSPYDVGKMGVSSLLGAITGGVILFFQQKRKLENNGHSPFPVILFSIILISFGITAVRYYLLADIRENMNIIQASRTDRDTIIPETKGSTKQLNYHGLNFSYPSNWKIETEETTEYEYYSVTCSNPAATSLSTFRSDWVKTEIQEKDFINDIITSFKEESLIKNQKFSPIEEHTFQQFKAEACDYSLTMLGEPIFGRIISFHTNGYSVLIIIQSDSIDKINTEFKVIENSFTLK